MITAEEARMLMPKDFEPTEKICERISMLSMAGIDYLWHDLTMSQVQQFKELGYKVEYMNHANSYTINWRNALISEEKYHKE